MRSSLAKIHSQCFAKGWGAEQFADLEYIAEGEKGFVAYQIVLDECEIKTICVLPEFRKQGIAAKLMRQLLEKAAGKKIFLEVSEHNLAAVNLYKKLGFKIFGERKNYYGPATTALLMQK